MIPFLYQYYRQYQSAKKDSGISSANKTPQQGTTPSSAIYSHKVGRTSSRTVIESENNVYQNTAHSSGIGSIAEPDTGMTTVVMSSEGNSSRGSESTDVPHYNEKNSNDEDINTIHINDHNYKTSPRKKYPKTFEMNHTSSNATLDSFTTLSSTKQNIELFKILTAIAVEIDSLQKSTEKRFSALENLVGKVQDEQKNLVNIEKSQTSNGTAKVCMHLY